MQKIHVGVLMGGKGIEREVSFNSGRTVCDHLDTSRYEIVPLFQEKTGKLYLLPWHFLHRGKITDFEHRLANEAQHITWSSLKKQVDFIYITTHGRYAEDGTLQGFLEVLNIPYLGSKVLTSALCMEKSIQKKILAHHNIAVPRGITIAPSQIADIENNISSIVHQLEIAKLAFPCIVKPHAEGSSFAINIAPDTASLIKAIQVAATISPDVTQSVIVEEKIEGMEFTCIIITDYKTGKRIPLPPTEIVPEKNTDLFDYEQKYMPGRAHKFTPARCSPEIIERIQHTCLRVMDIFDIANLARIDGFVTSDNRIVIIDPNTLAGMAPASFVFKQAAEIGFSHTRLINHLIETELHSYNMLTSIETENSAVNKIMDTKKIRVAVLMGGDSNEREISLESGRNITYKLSPQKYEVLPIFVNQNMELFKLSQPLLVSNSTQEINSVLDSSSQITWDDLPTIADFVFIGLHGGKGENGCIQGTLEMLGMPYNGSGTLASALCMNKFKTNEFLKAEGFHVPQSYLVDYTSWRSNPDVTITNILATLSFPLIVKPHDDGCSVMVQKINATSELINAVNTIFADNKEFALIEEYVIGMELTVGVIGNDTPQALPPSYTVTTADILSITEKFLPGAGENQTPAPLPESARVLVKKTMEEAYKAIDCQGYARIDCFYQTVEQSPTKSERVVILEINTLPGMTPATCLFHQAAEIGLKPMEFIDTIVQLGLQKHEINATIISRQHDLKATLNL